MFGVTDDKLIASLEALRRSLCAYGNPGHCDCKFGFTYPRSQYGYTEQTGCPEIGQAIKYLQGQREEVLVLDQARETSATNTLGTIRMALAQFDARNKLLDS